MDRGQRITKFGDSIKTEQHRIASASDSRIRERAIAPVQGDRCILNLPRRTDRDHEVVAADVQARSRLKGRRKLIDDIRGDRTLSDFCRTQDKLPRGNILDPIGILQLSRQLVLIVRSVIETKERDATFASFPS